jgi:carbon storage regulator
MLILSRRIGEAIVISDNVRILVLSASGGTVRLGIDAPREVEVHREEVYRRLKGEHAPEIDRGST